MDTTADKASAPAIVMPKMHLRVSKNRYSVFPDK
jgi:hypothetical protein